jgi:hypothetical protein
MEGVPLTLFLARRDRSHEDHAGRLEPADVQAATEAWYQKGLVDGMEKARASCDAELAAQQEDFNSRLDDQRRTWSETESAVLADHTSRAVDALQAEIEGTLAGILKPLLAQNLIEEALAKLAIEIGKLLSDDDAIKLKIFGPSDLVGRLKDRMQTTASVTVTARDQPEVAVFANKTVIETRLNEWLACIGVNSHAEEQER